MKKWPVSNYCTTTSRTCEESRLGFIEHKSGEVGRCKPQPVAYCFQLTVPFIVARQYMCSDNADNCERRQAWYTKNRPSKSQRVSLCDVVRNTNPYFPRDGEPFYPPSSATP